MRNPLELFSNLRVIDTTLDTARLAEFMCSKNLSQFEDHFRMFIPALLSSFTVLHYSCIVFSISDAPVNRSSTNKSLRMHALADGDEIFSTSAIRLGVRIAWKGWICTVLLDLMVLAATQCAASTHLVDQLVSGCTFFRYLQHVLVFPLKQQYTKHRILNC